MAGDWIGRCTPAGPAELGIPTSDESEPSWLEPWLELKDFRLGSGPFFTQLETKNWPKVSRNFDFVILNNYFSKIGLKMIKLCTMICKS